MSLVSIKHFHFGIYSYCVLVNVQVSIENDAKYVPRDTDRQAVLGQWHCYQQHQLSALCEYW